MRWTFETMGTVVSVATVDVDPAVAADHEIRRQVETVFQDYDLEFSRYRDDSAISRIARAELSLMDASDTMRSTYAAALEWRSSTRGAFTPHRPDGVDLDGIVKALAIRAAGGVLSDAGVTNWCLGCGGDVLMAGQAGPDAPWTIGVADPDNPALLLAQIPMLGSDRAIATSGVSERGEHIWRSDGASTLRQVTVIADDIVTADVLATAILSGGIDALDHLAHQHGVEVLALAGDELMVTPRLRALVATAGVRELSK
jgi:thiamine biosynthesis lipoprotein